jgi:hypothetical protein
MRAHPLADFSVDGLVVTTHSSVPLVPLVVEMDGLRRGVNFPGRGGLSWLPAQVTRDLRQQWSNEGEMLSRDLQPDLLARVSLEGTDARDLLNPGPSRGPQQEKVEAWASNAPVLLWRSLARCRLADPALVQA